MEHDLNILMIFGMKEKYNFDPYNVLLSIATNIPVLLMTGSRDTYSSYIDHKSPL